MNFATFCVDFVVWREVVYWRMNELEAWPLAGLGVPWRHFCLGFAGGLGIGASRQQLLWEIETAVRVVQKQHFTPEKQKPFLSERAI